MITRKSKGAPGVIEDNIFKLIQEIMRIIKIKPGNGITQLHYGVQRHGHRIGFLVCRQDELLRTNGSQFHFVTVTGLIAFNMAADCRFRSFFWSFRGEGNQFGCLLRLRRGRGAERADLREWLRWFGCCFDFQRLIPVGFQALRLGNARASSVIALDFSA